MNKRLKHKALITMMLAATFLTACTPATSQKRNTSLDSLYSGTWQFVAYGNEDNTSVITPGLRSFIAFQQNGILFGNAGCNNFFGTFTADDKGSFSIKEPLGSTRMFCEDFMGEEAIFLAALQSSKGFFFNDNDQLVINFKTSAEGFDFMLFIQQESPALLGTGWVLKSLVTRDGEVPVSPASAPFLSLSEDNSMNGNGGCNTIFSEFKVEDGRIEFGPIGSTRMYCDGLMEVEASYTLALDEVSRYEIISDQLILSNEDYTTVLTFFATEFMLEQTLWRLVVLNGEGIPENVLASLTLSPAVEGRSGSVFGSAGCNRYSGTYTLKEDRVTINIPVLTAMECDTGMEIEAAFIVALQGELTFQILNNRLILTSENDDLLFLGEQPSIAGQWRLSRMGTPENPVDITFEQTILADFTVMEGSPIGLLTGTTPCSNYSARFFTDRNLIAFSTPATSDLIQCAVESELEGQYFEALQNAAQYEFSQGLLIIRDAQGEQLLDFAAQF